MPAIDLDAVRLRLEAARKELIDLSLRNRLLNYRPSRSRGVSINTDSPSEVFQALVADDKTARFLPKKEEDLFVRQERGTSNRPTGLGERGSSPLLFRTNVSPSELERRLLKTYRDADLATKEQGVNLLFLAFGILEWYESEASDEPRRAPLVLVPVILQRSRVRGFVLNYEGTQVSGNPSLAAKLRDFRLVLPDIGDLEAEGELDEYYDKVRHAIAGLRRWRLDDRTIELGFFSYAKYLMYKDLDGTAWPDQEKPWQHDTLARMLVGGFEEPSDSLTDDDFLDPVYSVGGSTEVCDADSSQLLALLQARAGRTLVVEGPPGTGKSQTITNLIADAIVAGKKVLFVAEKAEAVNVVLRNLKAANLSEACLYLHGTRTRRKDFYEDLRKTSELGPPRAQVHAGQLWDLECARTKLNAYCSALNGEIENRGVTPYIAIGRLAQLGAESSQARRPDFALMAGWTQSDYEERLPLVQRLQGHVRQCGRPCANPFWGSGVRVVLPDDLRAVVEAAKAASEALALKQQTLQLLAAAVRWKTPQNDEDAEALHRVAAAIVSSPMHDGVTTSAPEWTQRHRELEGLLDAGRRRQEIRKCFRDRVATQAWDKDVSQAITCYRRHGRRPWRMLIREFRDGRKVLSECCVGKAPRDLPDKLSVLEAIRNSQLLEREVNESASLGRQLYGPLWSGVDSDWTLLHSLMDWVLGVHKAVRDGSLPPEVLDVLEHPLDVVNIRALTDPARIRHDNSTRATSALAEILTLSSGAPGLAQLSYADQRAKFETWANEIDRLPAQAAFNLLLDEMVSVGIGDVAQNAATEEDAGAWLESAFKRSWYNGVLGEAFRDRPELARFDRFTHDATVDAFQDLDKLLLRTNQVKAALKHCEGIPLGPAHGALGELRLEMQRARPRRSVREMMAIAGDAIQDIKPVFMMSPLSVAMYLPPEGPRFDLVIFDEASQVKPADAMGAIARSHQTIIVGDTKQLPPTSFFDRLTQEDEDDEDEDSDATPDAHPTQGMESILGLVSARIPSRSALRRDLRWHYRSRHHSLIAPSNRMFYRDRLFVFHSSDLHRRDMGLMLHHHPETTYGRGHSRRNLAEAKLVAMAAVEHAKNYPNLSLLVATFNRPQRDAIEDQLERLRQTEPALRRFDEQHPQDGMEPLDVRNLETVQGDQRDVVFVSVGYGRDENGAISRNFGPVNNVGGERRLNVLFTRARERCEVFSNLRAEDILIDANTGAGVRALRSYLHYAETGELDLPEPSSRSVNEFEEAVAAALEAAGYQTVPQVGSAGYFIDIGVCDPRKPGRFILGVECDGATYHSARSARDRDRLREEVLRDRGWRIHRVWSTEWFRHPQDELRKLVEAVERARAAEGPTEPAEETRTRPLSRLPNRGQPDSGVMPYEYANLNIKGLLVRDVEPTAMARLVLQVVRKEGPVHVEEVTRRIADAAGMRRLGHAAREAIQEGIKALGIMRSGIKTEDDTFLYYEDQAEPRPRDRSEFPAPYRRAEYVSPKEIESAVLLVVKNSYSITPDDAARAALKSLGIRSVDSDSLEFALEAVESLIDKTRVTLREGQLRLTD